MGFQLSFGSVAIDQKSPTRLVFATTGEEQSLLALRSNTIEMKFRSLPPLAMKLELTDLRRIHSSLYQGLCPKLPIAIGNFRGMAGSPLETATREVRVPGASDDICSIDPCANPDDVAEEMVTLHLRISSLYREATSFNAIKELASLSHKFLAVHPFLDGNGHTWRAATIGLAKVFGLTASAEWTVGVRPHGIQFSRALQQYPTTPELLESELGRFFH